MLLMHCTQRSMSSLESRQHTQKGVHCSRILISSQDIQEVNIKKVNEKWSFLSYPRRGSPDKLARLPMYCHYEYNKDTHQCLLFFNSNFVRKEYVIVYAVIFPDEFLSPAKKICLTLDCKLAGNPILQQCRSTAQISKRIKRNALLDHTENKAMGIWIRKD